MLGQYKQENARLRELLGSPLRQDEQKMVTQVISTVNDPYSDQVVIDKGSVNGVYEGQPVISDKGVVGQVVAVAKLTSRVLLICDATHALPIQVLRNDIRVIAAGNGCTDDLQLEHLPANTDIRVGDVLVTSDLVGVSGRVSGGGGLLRQAGHSARLYRHSGTSNRGFAAFTLSAAVVGSRS